MEINPFTNQIDEMNPVRSQTSQTILDAAKELVARKGPNGVTVRDITSASGANSASVNYYFQSKDRLVAIATQEITGDVNRERLRRLDELEQAKPVLTAHEILYALIEPILTISRSKDGGSLYVRSVFQFRIDARAAYSSFDINRHVAKRFIQAIRHTFPQWSEEEAIWRYEFGRGAAIHMLANLDPVSRRFEQLALEKGESLPEVPKYALDESQIKRVIETVMTGFQG